MADLPPGVTTLTSTVPALPAGLLSTIWLAVSLVKVVTTVVPKSTAVAPARFVPVMVTFVPPANGPAAGLMPVTVGAPHR